MREMQKSKGYLQSEQEIEALFDKGMNAGTVFSDEVADKLRTIKERNASQRLVD